MKLPKFGTAAHCVVTVLCMILYGLIAINYDNHIMPNTWLFCAAGAVYLAYIPWTVLRGLRYRKQENRSDWLVVAIAFSLFLILVFFGELSRYLNYTEILGRFS